MQVLTDKDVTEIRIRAAAGEQQTALAEEFGVSRQSVNDIVKLRRRTHQRVPLDPQED